MHDVVKYVIIALALALVCASARAQDYKLTARLEPAVAQTGDTVVYSLTIEHSSRPPQQIQPPVFDPSWGFSSPQFAGQKSSTVMNNTQLQQSVEYRFAFSVSKEGTFIIPPLSIASVGATFRSNPVTLTVTKPGAAAQGSPAASIPAELQGKIVPPRVAGNPQLENALNGAVFILPVSENTEPYEGQQMLISYHLCIDQGVLDKYGLSGSRMLIDKVDIPDLKQFLKEELFPFPQSLQWRETMIGGRKYIAAPLYQVAVTPTKTGKLEITPFSLSLWFSQRGRSRGSIADDPFFGDDPFFSGLSLLSGGNRIQVIARSPSFGFNVKPLPREGRPADFSGAVGNFKITTSLDKTQAVADEDLVRLGVKIQGNGDASVLSKPVIPDVAGLRMLEESKTTTDRRIEADQLVSMKNFDFLLRPSKAGKITIPPIRYSVFDPKAGKYTAIQSQPLELQVSPGTAKPSALVAASTAGNQATPSAREQQAPAPRTVNDDIRYIHTAPLIVMQEGPLTGEGVCFIIFLAVPPLLLLAGFVTGRRRAMRQTNREYFRERLAAGAARKHLRKAEHLLKQNQNAAFFEELASAVRGFFADKLHAEPVGLTIEQIEDHLSARNIPEQEISKARRLLDECDQARYSPTNPSPDSMRQALGNAVGIIGMMEKK